MQTVVVGGECGTGQAGAGVTGRAATRKVKAEMRR